MEKMTAVMHQMKMIAHEVRKIGLTNTLFLDSFTLIYFIGTSTITTTTTMTLTTTMPTGLLNN